MEFHIFEALGVLYIIGWRLAWHLEFLHGGLGQNMFHFLIN
jgi:hypothetical protein